MSTISRPSSPALRSSSGTRPDFFDSICVDSRNNLGGGELSGRSRDFALLLGEELRRLDLRGRTTTPRGSSRRTVSSLIRSSCLLRRSQSACRVSRQDAYRGGFAGMLKQFLASTHAIFHHAIDHFRMRVSGRGPKTRGCEGRRWTARFPLAKSRSSTAACASTTTATGSRRTRCPPIPLLAKKRLIEALTRRLFNHVEHGVNVPGTRLDEARHAVRARDRSRSESGSRAPCWRAPLQSSGRHLHEAGRDPGARRRDRARQRADAPVRRSPSRGPVSGKLVLHRSGEEGLDELWGEPFKAFAFPIEDFYNSRYIKIAQTCRPSTDRRRADRDVRPASHVRGIAPLVHDFAAAAKIKCETLRTDRHLRRLDLVRRLRRAARRVSTSPAHRGLGGGPAAGRRRDSARRRRQESHLVHDPREGADAQERPRTPRAVRRLPRSVRRGVGPHRRLTSRAPRTTSLDPR